MATLRPSQPVSDEARMLSVDEARARILAAFQPLSPTRLPVSQALGRVLAEPVVAPSPVPPFTNAAMDGYALRAADIAAASRERPVWLTVIGELPAGRPATFPPLGPGQAVRIMTGAVLPPGADTVVRFEDTSEAEQPGVGRTGSMIAVYRPTPQGENVRLAGEDVPAGHVVLPGGTVLLPAQLGLLAALGLTWVSVHRAPRVGILATGDEVVDPGWPLLPGQIRNSNNTMLFGLTQLCGGEPTLLGVARDDPDALRWRLRYADAFDVVLTSGGVSVGDYDLVKDVLRQSGRIELWQVQIKPGKPLAFGWIGRTPLIGLPGNPVAAFVAFTQFVRPALLLMQGFRNLDLPVVRARLRSSLENSGRRHFVRGQLRWEDGEYVVEPVPIQGAGVLSSVAQANALIILPESCRLAPAGSLVDVQVLVLNPLEQPPLPGMASPATP
jgi:molybdopterin molybdotransferase